MVICQLTVSTNFFPALLAFISYVFGIIMVVWGIFKIRDHANNPGQTPLMDGIMRLIGGGAFLALPITVFAIRSSLISNDFLGATSGASKVTTFNETDPVSCTAGLDTMLQCLMTSGFGPMNIAINLFSIFGGIVLIMIGISRLMKSTQEGAKGPLGIATIMTFVTGAALIASNTLLKVFAASMFGGTGTAATNATMLSPIGLTADELSHIHNIISAILKFLVIIGFISFVRGIFILRGSVEGSQNASTMAAMTHLIGGALAVNLGPLLNVLQNTFGINALGIAFS